ncbi:MAG TPA: response regulator [Anaeromyxobacteraceae bacterium]|jgi:two-component system chemotaxis response regulator CheY|nr:response regulator [Anaeromyxobacteraceae bacterium]
MAAILIVDDNPTIRAIVKLYLAGPDREFTEAADGEQALQALRRQPVDLVIVDVVMPRKDGLTFVRELRALPDPRLRALPVVLLTGQLGEEEGAERAREVGADALVLKPITGPRLQEAAEALLGRRAAAPSG